jgi:predicted RNA-binding protein YlqC (UPF0109 family)
MDVANSNATSQIQQMLTYIVCALVDHSQQVAITAQQNDGTTCFHLRFASTDMGRVIGKQGRTARAIRTLLNAASMKFGHSLALDIMEKQ